MSNNKQGQGEDKIADYLRQNPDFFSRHEDLLTELELPHSRGNTVSLVERQVSLLRERNIEMRSRLSNLLDNARDNDRLFDKTKRLVLALIECRELGDLVDALHYSFDKEFNIHYTRLIIFANEDGRCGPAKLVRINNARSFIGHRLKAAKAISGGIAAEEISFIFDDDAPHIGSAALAVLSHGSPLGVLAVGNQDPNYYNSGMGTIFLAYIAEVLNRLLPSLIEAH